MTAIQKNVYIDKLPDIGSKYNNSTIKMKHVTVNSSTYIEF